MKEKNNKINSPIKKNKKVKIQNNKTDFNKKSSTNSLFLNRLKDDSNRISLVNLYNFYSNKIIIKTIKSKNKINKEKTSKKKAKKNILHHKYKYNDINKIKELLSISFDEDDFDDAYYKEERTFCILFLHIF